MRSTRHVRLGLAAVGLAAACGGAEQPGAELGGSTPPAGPTFTVSDTIVTTVIEAAGIAAPFQRAVLATRLTGSVVSDIPSMIPRGP